MYSATEQQVGKKRRAGREGRSERGRAGGRLALGTDKKRTVSVGVHKGQKVVSDPLELEF